MGAFVQSMYAIGRNAVGPVPVEEGPGNIDAHSGDARPVGSWSRGLEVDVIVPPSGQVGVLTSVQRVTVGSGWPEGW